MSFHKPMPDEDFIEAVTEIRDMAMLRTVMLKLRQVDTWERLNSLEPSNLPDDASRDADDIMHDMIVELGFSPDDETSHLHRLLRFGFMMGASWLHGKITEIDNLEQQAVIREELKKRGVVVVDPTLLVEELGDDEPGISNIVENVPEWLYYEVLDEAAEAMIAQSDDPSDYHRGLLDGLVETFKRMSNSAGEPAERVVIRRALDIARQAGE